jgi:hypothetical protein
MLAAANVGVQTLTIWARQNLHSVSFSVRLKSSPLRRCCLSSMVLKGNLLTDPLSLYGRHLCRTVPACCTGMTCLNVRALQMFAAADILTLFSEKKQKPNSAHKCPITSIQIRTGSQKLSKFSCITFGSLNRGRPPFQPLFLKITNFWTWGERGGGKQGTEGPPSYRVWGRGRREQPSLSYIHSKCM